MGKAVDPVPEMYAKAFSGIESVRARLKILRERAQEPEKKNELVCSSPEESSDEAPTVECTPSKPRSALDEFREALAGIRAVML